MLWVVFAVLTGVSIFSVLWPLARVRQRDSDVESDIVFYEERLAEIDREVERSLIAPEDAQAVKAEAARRLLHSAETRPQGSRGVGFSRNRVRFAAVLSLVLVPAVAFGVYTKVGNPELPDEPLESRLQDDPSKMSLQMAIAKVEAHLAENPTDGRGYDVLAPAYLKIGRVEDAVRASQMAMNLLGESPDRLSLYGECLVFVAKGVVTKEAQDAFSKALALAQGGTVPKASLFLGLAAEQDGDAPRAVAIWSKLLEEVPTAPWSEGLRDKIASLSGDKGTVADRTAPAFAPQQTPQGAAIAAMPEAERDSVIRGMVDRLATRLQQNGQDVEGWLRLVRAYKVLNEGDKARSALGEARKSLSSDAAASARLDALARELGLEG
jgi:cytochrome c-type biogenesis protein CcmH